MQWTRSSRDTRSSVQHPSTWSTTESTVLLHSLRKTLSAVMGCRIGHDMSYMVRLETLLLTSYLSFELELASTRIISLIICYRTIVFLWVSPCKIVKVYQTLFCYNIIPWLFHLFWNRCNLLGIWKPLFLTPPPPPTFLCMLVYYASSRLEISLIFLKGGMDPFHVQI